MTIPRPEHPRPNFQRARWLNLNGTWQFAFDPAAIGEQNRWHRPGSPYRKDLTITVPFPWESRLSGVCAPEYKGAGWYEREITVPETWDDLHPVLNFGAVDWHARVWVNGRLVGENDNGYLPFSCDLSRHIRAGETGLLTVRAYDIGDPTNPVGKQVPRWYTYSSGIWQTVWLEARPASYIESVHISPRPAQASAEAALTVEIAQRDTYTVRLLSPQDEFPAVEARYELDAGRHQLSLALPVPEPKLWSPESPHCYDLAVELAPATDGPADRVTTYFGMRTVNRGQWDENEYEYILLNGEPVYLRGALDQAFHPDGLHNYPNDAVIRGDIQLAKDAGLNMLRCHIKINDPRYYYWADQLGVIILYDLPSADIDTPQMRRNWEATLRGAIARDFNHPSILAWILFNETWGLENLDTPEGQRWVQQMYRLAKQLDPTRLVEDHSPIRYDHVESDINSWHFYINDYRQVRHHIERVVQETYAGSSFNYVGGEFVQTTAPLINSEYAGISARMGDQDISWSFKYQTTELRRHAKICGYVYTELTDVEWEHNGFVNYDRSGKEFGFEFFVPEMSLTDLNGPDFVGFDAPPCRTLPPGGEFVAPVFVSLYGPELSGAQVRWQCDFIDHLGERSTRSSGEIGVNPKRFHVEQIDTLRVAMPDAPGLATVALWLVDGEGRVRCRNYVNVEVHDDSTTPDAQVAGTWLLPFSPGAFSLSSWDRLRVAPNGAKVSAEGSGWIEYALDLPAGVSPETIQRLRVRAEVAACAGPAKIDWPQRLGTSNYPQTEVKKFPSDLEVYVNDVRIDTVRLADDPADARGVLSHHHNYDPGSYGYLQEFIVDERNMLAEILRSPADVGQIRLRLQISPTAAHAGGLSIYGDRLGCYPCNPLVLLDRA